MNVKGVSQLQNSFLSATAKVKARVSRPSSESDSVEFSSKTNAPQKISFFRLLFHRLKDEDIKAINETGELPEGTKFVDNGCGGFNLVRDNCLVTGTRKLPTGYELKNNIFGFTCVVREGTEGLLLRKSA